MLIFYAWFVNKTFKNDLKNVSLFLEFLKLLHIIHIHGIPRSGKDCSKHVFVLCESVVPAYAFSAVDVSR